MEWTTSSKKEKVKEKFLKRIKRRDAKKRQERVPMDKKLKALKDYFYKKFHEN